MSTCDRIALMHQGRILQLAEPAEMYDRPADVFLAGFLGTPPIAFWNAEANGAGLRLENGQTLKTDGPADAGPVTLGIRPGHFGPQVGQGIAGRGHMRETQGREDLVAVRLDGGGESRAILPAGSAGTPGDRGDRGVDAGRILVFDPEGRRLRGTCPATGCARCRRRRRARLRRRGAAGGRGAVREPPRGRGRRRERG
jgi:inositol-phosphate transport system ATP-binding protein